MRNIKLVENLPFEAPQIEDITDKLPRKASWESLKKRWIVKGEWDGKTYVRGFRKPEQITTIVVHHSGSPEASITTHAKNHANRWGAGLAYHMSIEDGHIYQTNDLLSMTYHSAGNNTYTVSIEVNRDLSKADLTDDERRLLYAAILTLKSVLPTITDVKGHNELPTCQTACPCTSMDRIRADIAAIEKQMNAPKPATLTEELNNTPNATMAQVYAAYSRFTDLYNIAQKAGPNQAEAQRKIIQIADMMTQAGILVK